MNNSEMIDEIAERVAELEQRLEKLETEAGEAITALANGGIELDKRIEKLEAAQEAMPLYSVASAPE